MADITSTQNGNWNVGATWVGGTKPGTGDTATIAHVVTIASTSEACGNVTVNATKTLTFDANTGNSTLTLDNGATLTNDGTVNFANNGTNHAVITSSGTATITGTDFDWDSGGAGTYVDIELIDYQIDITTGGSGVTIRVTDDITHDGITVTNGDDFGCVVAGTTFTGNNVKDFNIYGTLTLTGGLGNLIILTGYRNINIKATTAQININYITATGIQRPIWYQATPTSNSVQNSEFHVTATTYPGLVTSAGVSIAGFSTDTFDGGNDASWARCDIMLNNGSDITLDSCTFTTVGATVAGWLVSKDASSNFTIYGVLASSETPGAGFRAADVTGNLTLSKATKYGTDFDTSYTLGAAMANVNDITVDANCTLDPSATNYQITCSGDVDINGTKTSRAETFRMTGTSNTLAASGQTFYNLTCSATAVITITENITIASGGSLDPDTNGTFIPNTAVEITFS